MNLYDLFQNETSNSDGSSSDYDTIVLREGKPSDVARAVRQVAKERGIS